MNDLNNGITVTVLHRGVLTANSNGTVFDGTDYKGPIVFRAFTGLDTLADGASNFAGNVQGSDDNSTWTTIGNFTSVANCANTNGNSYVGADIRDGKYFRCPIQVQGTNANVPGFVVCEAMQERV